MEGHRVSFFEHLFQLHIDAVAEHKRQKEEEEAARCQRQEELAYEWKLDLAMERDRRVRDAERLLDECDQHNKRMCIEVRGLKQQKNALEGENQALKNHIRLLSCELDTANAAREQSRLDANNAFGAALEAMRRVEELMSKNK